MSSPADVAVSVFRELEPEDIRVLTAIELGMARHEYVPDRFITAFSGLNPDEVSYRLRRLHKFGLIRRWSELYVGYILRAAGYDCLAINALVKADVIQAFGKRLGVGKEADVYTALTPGGEEVAVKFHRLGRMSFRKTRVKRSYVEDRMHISWLYQSRLAAKREYRALKLVYEAGVSVPRPIAQNRHVVVMGMIHGDELVEYVDVGDPQSVLLDILDNVRKAYLKAGVVHSDLSEYNVILKPDGTVLIIDWPQYVTRRHPNAEDLLARDVRNIVKYFRRKFHVEANFEEALEYVKGLRDEPPTIVERRRPG